MQGNVRPSGSIAPDFMFANNKAPPAAIPKSGQRGRKLTPTRPRRRRTKAASSWWRFPTCSSGPDPLYLVDELIPIRGLVDVWGKAKCCKSFWTYDLCFHIARAGSTATAMCSRVQLSIAPLKARTATRSAEAALKRHYNIEEGAHVPLYLVSGTINLISEHSLLIADNHRAAGRHQAGSGRARHVKQVAGRIGK